MNIHDNCLDFTIQFDKWILILQTINNKYINRVCEEHFKSSDIEGSCMTDVMLLVCDPYLYF